MADLVTELEANLDDEPLCEVPAELHYLAGCSVIATVRLRVTCLAPHAKRPLGCRTFAEGLHNVLNLVTTCPYCGQSTANGHWIVEAI